MCVDTTALDLVPESHGYRAHGAHGADFVERQRMKLLFDSVPGVIWEEWYDGTPRFVSAGVERMLGYTPGEYLTRFESFLELVHNEDREAVRARTAEAIERGDDHTHTFRMIGRDGRLVWCESHCRIIREEEGMVVGMRGISLDVTSRVEAERRARVVEEQFRQITDLSPVLLWIADAAGNLTFANRSLLELVGVDPASVVGRRWTQLVHPDDRDQVLVTLQRAIESRSRLRYEARWIGPDGREFKLFVEGTPRLDESGALLGFVGSALDLTILRQLERRLEQRERFGGLASIAGTIAHELNNVLMAIQPLAEKIEPGVTPELLEKIGASIRSSVSRGGRITREVLQLGTSPIPQLSPVDLADWLPACGPEIEAILGPGTSLTIDVDPPLHVLADGAQLQQVLSNLATNARDAMPTGGTLRIRAFHSPYADGIGRDAVTIEVADDGCGMDGKTLERLFDPLFTTKRNGLGLGMPLVHNIIRSHHGEIQVESAPGCGTRFTILLPATPLVPASRPAAASAVPAPRIQRLLLVEDDLDVATGLVTVLEMEGFEVAVASTGGEVLETLESWRPGAVILDVNLPDVPGTEVYGRIREHHPDLPVIFSTGHTGKSQLEALLTRPHTRHLLKPYELRELLAAIADAVAG